MGATGYWLNERRLLLYAQAFVAVYALSLLSWLIAQVWLAETPVTTLRIDFAAFWSIGHMVLEGRASDAYVPDLALAAQAALVPQHDVRLPWFYPPQVFALVAPFAALPFLPAFFLWTAGGLACLAWSIRALAPNTPAIWLLLASPGLFWILRFGQTGVLAAALLGGGLYFMARGRPILAGVLIGLLTFKPHLGLLIPFALIAGKEWRVFAAASLTTLGLAAASTLAFGAEIWPRYFEAMGIAMDMQSRGALPHNQLVSLYAALRTLGLGDGSAVALQALLSLAALALVVRIWHGMGACLMSGALLAAGCLLAAPHLLGYDLALYAPAVAILAADGLRRGWLPGERESYMLLWLWPLVSGVIGELTRFPVGVAGSLLLFALAYRRCRALGPEETG